MKKIPSDVLEMAALIWWEFSQIATGRALRVVTGSPPLTDDERTAMQRAEKLGYLERLEGRDGEWVWNMSALLDKRMMGEESPIEYWTEKWKGEWTLVTFDIAREKKQTRAQLHYLLRRLGFGCLQGSVWVSTRPAHILSERLQHIEVDPSEVCVFEARISGEDLDVVEKAWDWQKIQTRYEDYRKRLDELLDQFDKGEISGGVLAAEDSLVWKQAIEGDPFLPEALWPEMYSGFDEWEYRRDQLKRRVKRLKASKVK